MKKFYDDKCESYLTFFRGCEKWFSEKPYRLTLLKISGKASTVLVYAAYILLLALLAVKLDERIIPVTAVPLAVFCIVTVIRKKINAPRPYERLPIKPLVHKSTKGKSCPSRHSACAFVIALACLYVSLPLGIIVLLTAFFIAAIRPVMGVHFPLDTLFGGLLSVLLGGTGFFLFYIFM
ncbi:MAG: phosphatase PAP2 family protein [Huintestinicola sp.]